MSEVLEAVMPGLVVAHVVANGDRVRAGDAVLVTETMKCETVLRAPLDGVVEIHCAVGDVVTTGDKLAHVMTAQPAPSDSVGSAPKVRSRRPPRPKDVVSMLCTNEPNNLQPWAATGQFEQYWVPDHESPAVPLEESHRGDTNVAVVFGVMTHVVDGHPEGATRVWIGGDPALSMGAVSEAECRYLNAAFDLADHLNVPVEWVAVSAGARIAWDSGTENMDWCATVVARIIRFTQAGGTINIIVSGINVGAQSYWNAEATMLTHHKGALIMIDDTAMVLTGRRALALSGGGNFASDRHIGGYAEVMGPNGQAHHVVSNLTAAYRLMFTHIGLTQRRRDGGVPSVSTSDPIDRDMSTHTYTGAENFATIADVLDAASHPDRKQPFAIRPVLDALVDCDAPVLERWADMHDARGVVAWDTRLGGRPITLIGVEGRPYPSDSDPDRLLAGGTLHPEGSRKCAKAINAASGNRPVVIVASLAGFDGSAYSMKHRQLEFGAEIARAVVNFDGPVIVAVIGRFHGGAYVVFSKALGNHVTIVALDGSYVSVIGGDAAAGVVFAGEAKKNAEAALAADASVCPDQALRDARETIARRFDDVHDVHRAASVGSIDQVISPDQLRLTLAHLTRSDRPFSHPDVPQLQHPQSVNTR